MSDLQLNSLEIQGFRIFEHLTIDRLAQVNLIVGKNNVGKSCLLEALRLYAQRGSPVTIRDILEARDELWETADTPQAEQTIESQAIRFLFHGRGDFITHSPVISIGELDEPESRLGIATNWYEEQFLDQKRRQWHKIAPEVIHEVADRVPGLEVKLGDTTLISYPLNTIFVRIRSLLSVQNVPNIPCVFLPANGLSSNDIARLWDDIALKPEEEEILNGLHIIAPEVERINLLGHSEAKLGRVPMVRMHGLSDPLPLRSIGEGMTRLFGVTLALVNAQQGLLLIDEVDSGLHYAVYPSLWRLIFQVAARLNVQVFATTHSWDCIKGFQQVAQEMGERAGMLIRLERRQGHIVPILFDEARLGIATRQDIEVR